MARPQRFTGAEPPLHVFQDEYYQTPNYQNTQQTYQSQQTPRARQPLQPTSQNAILNPPSTYSANQSPYKTKAKIGGIPPRTPLKTKGASKLNMVQMLPPTSHPSGPSTDSLTKKQPPMSRFKTVSQKPSPEFRVMHFASNAQSPPTSIYPAPPPNPMQAMGSFHYMEDKENAHLAQRPVSQGLQIMDETYQTKSGGKRQLLEAAPIKEQRPAKKPKLDEGAIPAHDAFPSIEDDGEKPAISYANLIGMAILRSPQRKLTLSQIYKWISETFRWYNLEDAGWQNSIRHNLSLNKAFIKQERPKNDPGKGHYWSIEPGKEHQFLGKEKPGRKPAVSAAENFPVMSTRLEPQPSPFQPTRINNPQSTPTLEPAQHFMPRPPSVHFQRPVSSGRPMQPQQQTPNYQSLPALPTSSARPTTAEMPQPSSDATILLASDNATIEDVQDILDRADEKEDEVNLYSPLPAAMHSSPPVPRHHHVEISHGMTPPRPVSRHHGSSITNPRTHKRQFASMDDSGYISSLESSAMRPNAKGQVLTSEADRPRIKRGRVGGRAEEEIARLRASSYDSPTKIRTYGGIPLSSSPLRKNTNSREGQMLPPLTPAMKLKAPMKPPPSASPGTNLLRHRQNVQKMIESPFRRASQLPKFDSAVKLTPGPRFDEHLFNSNADLKRGVTDTLFPLGEFDIYADPGSPSMFLPGEASPLKLYHGNGSPIKRSVKRPRLERPHSTSSVNMLKLHGNNAQVLKALKDSPATSNMHKFQLPSSPLKLFTQSHTSIWETNHLFPGEAPSKYDLENVQPDDDGTDGTGYGDPADAPGPWFTIEDMCDTEQLLDDDQEDDNGFDILGGFQKIGSSSQPLLQPSQPQRPGRSPLGKLGLGRSYSTNF